MRRQITRPAIVTSIYIYIYSLDEHGVDEWSMHCHCHVYSEWTVWLKASTCNSITHRHGNIVAVESPRSRQKKIKKKEIPSRKNTYYIKFDINYSLPTNIGTGKQCEMAILCQLSSPRRCASVTSQIFLWQQDICICPEWMIYLLRAFSGLSATAVVWK